MPQAGRQSNKRFSLTDLADDDPIERTDLMSPTLVPTPAPTPAPPVPEPEPVVAEVPTQEVAEETNYAETVRPADQVSTPAPAPTPAQPATRANGSRVSRQSREVTATLDPTLAHVENQKDTFYSNFSERRTKKQISLRIHPDVDKALTKEVLTKNLEGITVTREAIITKAVCVFLGIPYPEDM